MSKKNGPKSAVPPQKSAPTPKSATGQNTAAAKKNAAPKSIPGRLRGLWQRPAVRLVGLWALLAALAVFCVYYWRVFYSFDRLSPLLLTALAVGVVSVLYGVALGIWRFVPGLAARAALLLAAAGVCFCFASPPLQVPDESEHFLRAYAVSMGRFDFDAARGYPAEVDLLVECFPGAYTNGNNGAPIKQYYQLADPDDPDSTKLPQGPLHSIADCFARWHEGLATLQTQPADADWPARQEPLVVLLLPYLHQALAMALTRAAGGTALACLYAGRLANLAAYAALAYFALRGLRRWQGPLLAVLFLPLSLYMAASCNYDALLLGLYALAFSLLLREKFGRRQLIAYIACVAVMNTIKPWINLLWLFGLLFCDKKRRDTRLHPAAAVGVAAGATLAATALVTWYGRSFRLHYGEVGRMLGSTVDPLQQLLFVLHNPLRTAAVLWGTLYENTFFLPGLGLFGALDTPAPAVAWLSVLLLALGVLACAGQRPLSARANGGLGCFCLLYALAAMMGMYITYTPVGMVRVIGLQARYFLPSVLAALVLLGQGLGALGRRAGLRAAMPPPQKALPSDAPAASAAQPLLLTAAFIITLLGALLLCETYFIGPVSWVPV